jgi:hypothetical protein
MNTILKNKVLTILACLGIIVLLNIIYFLPQFQGKVLRQGDIVQWEAMASESINNKSQEPVLWMNNMFGGMPGYQTAISLKNNYVNLIGSWLQLKIANPTGFFVMGMLSFLISMIALGISPWLSLLGSVGFAFASSNLVIYEAGHNSKLLVVFCLPLILSGIVLITRKAYLKGGIIFAIGLALTLYYNHPQMLYYFFITLLLFAVLHLIEALKNKELIHLGKSLLTVGIGTALALASSATILMTTYEFQSETMRGKPILQAESTPTSPSQEAVSNKNGGLDYEYAMRWSNGSPDLLSHFIPFSAGGATYQWISKSTDVAKRLGQNRDIQLPMYWGPLPFTSGPFYLGILSTLFFLFGFLITRSALRWWLFLGLLLSLALSCGKNFPLLNDLFFYHFPLFNKFRTPNSIMCMATIFMPVMMCLGIHEVLIKSKEDRLQFLKPLVTSISIVAGFCFLFALLGPSFFNFTNSESDKNIDYLPILLDARRSMFTSSAFKSGIIVLLGGGIFYSFLKGWLNQSIMILGLFIVLLFDLLPVAQSYVSKRDFVRSNMVKESAQPRQVDTQILQDKDPHYRVHDVTGDPFNSASSSAYHKTIGGYSPAKLQRIQDLIERHISKGNQQVFNMLNVKYFIFNDQNNQPQAQQNPGAYGNAWFVDSIQMVNSNNAEIDALNDITINKAVVHSEFNNLLAGFEPVKNGSIKLTNISTNKLEFESNANSEQLALFSEIWYGPNKGWKATIDGKQSELFRANYLLRAMKVPSGAHKIVMEFKPDSYYLGEKISAISSLILVLGFLVWLGFGIYKMYTNNNSLKTENI